MRREGRRMRDDLSCPPSAVGGVSDGEWSDGRVFPVADGVASHSAKFRGRFPLPSALRPPASALRPSPFALPPASPQPHPHRL